MSKQAQRLKSRLTSFTSKDRKALARYLFDAMPNGEPEQGPEDDEAWSRELDRRSEELKHDPSVAIPGELVFARLRKLYS